MFRSICLSCILTVMCFMSAHAQGVSITVSSQKSFNSMRAAIDNKVKAGEKQITVIIEPGTYEFVENHLTLKNLDYHDVDLTIIGPGAVITGAGERIERGAGIQKLNRYWCYLSDTGEELDAWSPFMQSDSEVEVLDAKKGECRIHCTAPIADSKKCDDQYITITESFKSVQCKVTSIKGGYIYFTTDDTGNINLDYTVAKRHPRFKLLGNSDIPGEISIKGGVAGLPGDVTSVKTCQSSNFLYVEGSHFKSLRIESLKFKGSKESSQLMTFIDTDAANGISIRICEFRNIHGDVISLRNTDNVTVDNCLFAETYRGGIKSDNKSSHTVVRENRFAGCGIGVRNSACVTCSGTDYLVKDNVFENFGYSAVSVGLHYTSKRYEPISGTVEGNNIYNTAEYNAATFDNSLMDSGAIYLMTNNDNSVVAYNYVHDVAGYYSNNGIYCDDGAKGFKLYANIITNIAGGYTIYSRRVGYIENLADSQVKKTNVDNQMMFNILDGKYMFAGRPGDNNCVKGCNYLIKGADGSVPVLKASDLPQVEDDVVLDNVTMENGKIKIARKEFRKNFSSAVFDPIRKYLK